MKNDKLVTVTYYDGEKMVSEKAYVEYIGHSHEKVSYTKHISTGMGYIDVSEEVPMQDVVYVCRLLASGNVIKVKPEAVRYESASVTIKG